VVNFASEQVVHFERNTWYTLSGISNKDPVLSIKVLLEFLIALYDENISELKKNFWFNYALNYLPREIWNLSDILDILNNEIQLFIQSQRIHRPHLHNWLIRGIRLWSNKQILPIQYEK
jgi:hypothetical protein